MTWSGAATASQARDGKLPPVGNTVDVAERDLDEHHRRPELITVWKDPNFDASQRAFYYARVHRNSDAALDRLRCQALRHEASAGHADDHHRARLHVSDLVQPGHLRPVIRVPKKTL